jgi:dephospho-CoA kinase
MSSRGLIFGITGQTGAGKSAVCAYLKEAGYHVIDADAVSRQVMGPGSGCAKELAEFFGTDILNADGTLNRKLLGAIAFGDNEKLAALNRITHPYILKEVFSRAQAAFKSGAGVVFFDAPTLFESGAYKNCDYVISVLAQKD